MLEDKLKELREFYKTETNFIRKERIKEIAELYKKAGENPQPSNINYRRAKTLETGIIGNRKLEKDIKYIFTNKQLEL